MKKFKVGMVSLGCDKNRVDSELILGSINKEYEITNNPKEADIIIVNTCGFIDKAKEESINTIIEMAEYKTKYKCKMLIATGCLTQRYGDELLKEMPEIDILMGVNNYMELHKLIKQFINEQKQLKATDYSDVSMNEGIRILTTDKHTAYVRIAEGCNNFCTYCIIPKIRGKFRSRSEDSILKEIEELSANGVKEIILIAQDLTCYGIDIHGKKTLDKLINKISKIDGIEWVRLMYCYPEELTDELIEEIKTNPKVTKYLDIPIQHISNNVLRLMARKTTKETIVERIQKLRKEIPDIALRTSIIVGFPQETEEDFNELKEFLIEKRIDYVGVFKYSQEEGTPAANMEGQISEDVKEIREKKLMLLQKDIVKESNKLKVGKKYDIIVEGKRGEFYIGRTQYMAPEIDTQVFVKSNEKLNNGEMKKVKIIDIREYDLIGVVCNESS